jgi:hypothetical protein
MIQQSLRHIGTSTCTHGHTWTHTDTHGHTRSHMHTQAHIGTHTHTHIKTHPSIHRYTDTQTHTHTQTDRDRDRHTTSQTRRRADISTNRHTDTKRWTQMWDRCKFTTTQLDTTIQLHKYTHDKCTNTRTHTQITQITHRNNQVRIYACAGVFMHTFVYTYAIHHYNTIQ